MLAEPLWKVSSILGPIAVLEIAVFAAGFDHEVEAAS
jgi:hypothetical protein